MAVKEKQKSICPEETVFAVTLRYLADAPQLPDSIPAQPRLEDLYLWLFPEEMEEAK